jgi:hypothetical protein
MSEIDLQTAKATYFATLKNYYEIHKTAAATTTSIKDTYNQDNTIQLKQESLELLNKAQKRYNEAENSFNKKQKFTS